MCWAARSASCFRGAELRYDRVAPTHTARTARPRSTFDLPAVDRRPRAARRNSCKLRREARSYAASPLPVPPVNRGIGVVTVHAGIRVVDVRPVHITDDGPVGVMAID